MLVVGITGPNGAGKGTVAEILARELAPAFRVSLSDLVREEAAARNWPSDRQHLQDLGNEERAQKGPEYWAKQAADRISKSGLQVAIVDSIRNPYEVHYLQNAFGNDFMLIAVNALPLVRFDRIAQRAAGKSEALQWKDWVELDMRDRGKEQTPEGLQIDACMELAQKHLKNNDTLAELEEQVKTLAAELKQKTQPAQPAL